MASWEEDARAFAAFDSLLEGVQLIDFDWRYRYVNPALVAQSRLAASAMVGKTVKELYPGVEASELFAALARCMTERTPQRIESEFRHPGGGEAWYDLSVQPHDVGILILSWDITERKRRDQELRRTEHALRTAQRLAHVGSWEIDVRTGARWASDELCAIYGLPPGTPPESFGPIRERWHPDDLPRVEAALRGVEAGEDVHLEGRYVRAPGDVRWLVARGETERDESGAPVRRYGTVQDVTVAREAEEAAGALRDELKAIVDASPLPIVAFDAGGRVSVWSAAAERTFGYSAAEVRGKPVPVIPAELAHEVELSVGRAKKGLTTDLVT